ncbi:hypothetical protein PENSUB_2327 [Penicillium subrubescens]|uniref:Uncharacterized protein n=1 Tax=Penicillium subrubescens TaxID=1316194 RepID=A0A1Q5UI55_9EURO|nr:hypothetical protein PENSUB_2327 [Penicillium subrubescens]
MDSLSSASSCEDLIQQLQRLMTSDAYSELLLIVKENAILRQHERDLNITNEQNLKTLGHLQQNLETATEQIAEYSTQVDGLTQEIQRLQIALNNAQGNMKIKDEELRENKKRDQLQDMFKLVHSLIVEFFGHDLENPAFQDQTTWENLRNHDLLKRIVPLPLSNTTSAKDMRVAALIGICAEAMSRHIFQSTYLLDGSQLHELIDALQSYDWNQGSYLRSVLLRSLITEQKENSLKRTKRLVAEVLKLTKPLLSAKRQVLFEDALLVVCKKITEQWMQFQELEAAVEPDFELNDDAGDWKLFLFPKRAMNNNVEFPQDPDPKKAEAKLSMMQTNFVVWPAFFISEAGELELLRPGFALSEEQMQPAKSEENAISSRRARQEARRTNRRKAKISAT